MTTEALAPIEAVPRGERPEQHFKILNDPAERVMIEFGIAELLKKVRDEHYEALVFLDKGARPFEWMFDRAWKKLFPTDQRPTIHFINPPKEFTLWTQAEYRSAVKDYMPGKKILMVDELSHSGQSFERTERVIRSKPTPTSRTIDKFEVMQTYPSWYGESDPLTGTVDSDVDDLFSVANPTPQSLKFRKECAALADQLINDFPTISSHLDLATRRHQNQTDLQEFFQRCEAAGIPIQPNESQENIIDHDALLQNIEHLSRENLVTLYGLIRKGVIQFEYALETGWNLLNPENNHPFKVLSEVVEQHLPHAQRS